MKKFNENDFVKATRRYKFSPGEMLKELREIQELTQAELSDLTGIPQSNISAMESGAVNIGRDRSIVLARILHVHPSLILFSDYDENEVA